MAVFQVPTIELRLHPRELLRPSRSPDDAPSVLPILNTTAPPSSRADCSVTYVSAPAPFLWKGAPYVIRTLSFYYAENLALGCWGTCIKPRSQRWGYHTDDFESVTMAWPAEQKDGGPPAHVFFHAHSQAQGQWRAWETCEKTADGALIVYVALHSHASYPMPGRYRRVFGLADDVCDKNGPRVRPTAVYPPPQNVFDGVARAPAQVSITAWGRFMLALRKDLQ